MSLDTKKQMAGDSKYQKTVGEGRISQRHNFNINSYVHFTSVYPVHVQGEQSLNVKSTGTLRPPILFGSQSRITKSQPKRGTLELSAVGHAVGICVRG